MMKFRRRGKNHLEEHNNSLNASTKITPFFARQVWHPPFALFPGMQ